MKSLLLCMILAFSLAPAEVFAQPFVEYIFNAEINRRFGGSFLGLSPNVGESFTGRFSYDLSVPDSSATPLVGRFLQSQPSFLSIELGETTVATDSPFLAFVQNNNSGFDALQIAGGNSVAGDGNTVLVDGVAAIGTLEILLSDNSGNAFTSDRLPTTLNFTDFTNRSGIAQNGSGSGANFTITSLTLVSVPEPSSMTLLTVVGLATMCRRRRT